VLAAVGDLLEAKSEDVGIVVVGGASLNLLGLIERTTGDVDVIARVHPSDDGPEQALPEQALIPPEPMPESLMDAVETVARDFDLPANWMNAVIGAQWDLGLPPRLEEDLTWRTYGGLRVGLAGRRTLIALKLFAAVDQGPESVHVQDLVSLRPNEEELEEAAGWVRAQDASPEFATMTHEVVQHVRRHST
jgi:hypothetical protein